MKRAVINFLWSLALGIGACMLAVGVVLTALWGLGYSPTAVAKTWAIGAAGDWAGAMTSLRAACPLILTGLAAGVAFRCGVFNIGGEGQFMAGSIAAVAVAAKLPPSAPAWLAITLAMSAGAFAGAAVAIAAALLERYRNVPLVLSTILLNAVVMYAVKILVTGPLQMPKQGEQSVKVPEAFRLSVLHADSGLHTGIFIALIAAMALWVLQSRTRFGFELLVTGQNSEAARLAGIPVQRRAIQVMAISGALAGLGGAILLLGELFFETGRPGGYGYAGVAVALLGRLHPLGIIAGAIFFGMLDIGALQTEIDSDIGLSHYAAGAVKGILLLVLLSASAWARRFRMRAARGEVTGG